MWYYKRMLRNLDHNEKYQNENKTDLRHEKTANLVNVESLKDKFSIKEKLIIWIANKLISSKGFFLKFPNHRYGAVGPNPQQILVTPPSLYRLFLLMLNPNYQLGEYYTKGYWYVDHEKLVDLLKILLIQRKSNLLVRLLDITKNFKTPLYFFKQKYNLKMKNRVDRHYDDSVGFFKKMIGKNLIYTCAIFDEKHMTLEQAQDNKVNLIAQRLEMDDTGQKVLDIGCGWGEMAFRFADEFSANVDGITISKTQFKHIFKKQNNSATKNSRVSVFNTSLQNFHPQKNTKYDRIFSVGVFEHFGEYNQADYFNYVHDLLAPKGIALTHCVTAKNPRNPNPWIEKHIFPGHFVPTQKQVEDHIQNSGLVLKKTHIIPPEHYARTLRNWRARFIDAFGEEADVSENNEQFKRINFYLASCEASFDSQTEGLHVCHYVCEKP